MVTADADAARAEENASLKAVVQKRLVAPADLATQGLGVAAAL